MATAFEAENATEGGIGYMDIGFLGERCEVSHLRIMLPKRYYEVRIETVVRKKRQGLGSRVYELVCRDQGGMVWTSRYKHN
jgi:hypothetical protein